jgi:chromosomal replication initiation ATPase DnaA
MPRRDPRLSRQLRLPLARPSSFRREEFVVSMANAEAVRLVESWPDWHGGCLALIGPKGTGKSHLAFAWAEAAKATALTPDATHSDLEAVRGRPVLAEDAERFSDEALFHLINMAGEPGAGLLLTSREAPALWPAELPDLRSRLNALPVAELGAPDDAILQGVIEKFFRERNIRPAEDLFPYLIRRIERSAPAAKEVVLKLDEAADARQRAVSRALAREILDAEPDLFDGDLADEDRIGEKS